MEPSRGPHPRGLQRERVEVHSSRRPEIDETRRKGTAGNSLDPDRDPNHLASNLLSYVKGFSENVRESFIERFKLPEQVARLDEANVLFLVTKRFAEIDRHPEVVPNHMMGSIFEDLIR